jgi:nicotinate-nucleotide adenylyltransferase
MKIAVLGGTFDPPHLGHLFIASQVKELLNMDQVWLMPLYQKTKQDKIFHKSVTDAGHRLAMTKFLENDFIKVSDFEIENNPASYSLITLQKLQSAYPEHEFFWILGSDQLEGFQKYFKWQELVKTQNLIVFPREHMLWNLEERVKETMLLQTIPQNVIVLHNKNLILTNISSTKIKERIKAGLVIDLFVTGEISEYIKTNNLYR